MTTLRPILLADDNSMDVDLTPHAFKRNMLANPVEVARDGEEVLAWIGRWESGEPWPVVILLDINMPKMDGLEVLGRLKAHPTIRTIPVIMLTTSAASKDVQTAYLQGANSYIVKPADSNSSKRSRLSSSSIGLSSIRLPADAPA
jgi:CheY-like chemotaxis protein